MYNESIHNITAVTMGLANYLCKGPLGNWVHLFKSSSVASGAALVSKKFSLLFSSPSFLCFSAVPLGPPPHIPPQQLCLLGIDLLGPVSDLQANAAVVCLTLTGSTQFPFVKCYRGSLFCF